MQKTPLTFIAAALFLFPGVSTADDEYKISGDVSLGLLGVTDNDNSAKFQEYRDLSNGVLGEAEIDVYKNTYYLEMEAIKIGREDQSYLLEGGRYRQFNYRLYYDQIPHNLSFDARTFYTGVGGNDLTISGVDRSSPDTWSTFDYKTKRKKVGGGFDISMDTPYLFILDLSSEKKEGLVPLGSGGFGGATELPEPVDYTTNDGALQAAFRDENLTIKLTGALSNFENNNNFLRWQDSFSGGTDVNTLAPDNDYGRIAFDLAWRQLPMMSTLAVLASYARIENDLSAGDIGITVPTGLDAQTFSGDISYTNLSAAFSSRLTEQLDTQIYYKYQDKDNDSTVITVLGDEGLTSNVNQLFDYQKHQFGLDAVYSLPRRTVLEGRYEFLDTDRRNRPDGENSTDNSFILLLRNSSLDFMSAKIQYQYLNRDADFNVIDTDAVPTDASYIERFVKRYDTADKDQNRLKANLEFYPADTLDFGVEYIYEKNDYDEVVLGRLNDSQHKLYLDGQWRMSELICLGVYVGYEKTEADTNHYNYFVGSGTPPQLADPTVNDGNPSSYRWTQEVTGDLWDFGLFGEARMMEDRLKLTLSWDYQDSNGESSFTSEGTSLLEPFPVYDDYSRHALEAKLNYAVTRQWQLIFGFLYEKFKFDDFQYNGYEYLPPGTVLSGAYLDNSYEESLGYLTVAYTF